MENQHPTSHHKGQSETTPARELERWEYKVVHININTTPTQKPATPEAASEKLQGSLSPEYIEREFPKIYQNKPSTPKHPAEQLQNFLNLLGNEGWEFVETTQVGRLLMFFFKRRRLVEAASTTDQEKTGKKDIPSQQR